MSLSVTTVEIAIGFAHSIFNNFIKPPKKHLKYCLIEPMVRFQTN